MKIFRKNRCLFQLNTVIMKGVNEDELCDFVALTTEDRISVRFLEFMPFSGNAWSQRKFIPYQAQIDIIEKHFGRLQRDDDERSSTSMVRLKVQFLDILPAKNWIH